MIADVFAKRSAATSVAGFAPRDPALSRLWGLAPQAASGAEVNTKSVLGLSPVFRAVNIIGNGVAKCRPIIYQRLGEGGRPDPQGRDKRRAMEHPSWRATVRRANQWMSAGEYAKTVTINAILRGNGIGHVERDGAGRVLEYCPLLPDRTGMAVFNSRINEDSIFPESNEGDVLYWTIVGGQMRTILPENIQHIRGLSTNGVWGVDVIEVMRETLGLAIAARDCGARFYGQGMLGSGILYMPTGMTRGPKNEETIANFIKSVKEQAQGLSKAHRLLVIDEGAKFEKLSVDPEGAQALQTREFEVREIANVVGCQSHKLGDTKRTGYASLEQSNQEHLDDDIDPWLTRWEESYEDVALTEQEKESGSHFVECNRKALMRTNLAVRASYYTQARNGGWMSVNDIRRAEGDDPIGSQGDAYLIPLNMIPADQAASGVIPADGASGTGGSGDTPVDENASQLTHEARQKALAADYRAIALHECGRLIKRTCDEAVRRSAKGGADYLAFLDSIDTWCQEPAPLRPVLQELGKKLHHGLNIFTEPPFTAADLKTHVEVHIDAIRKHANEDAAELVEQLTTNNEQRTN